MSGNPKPVHVKRSSSLFNSSEFVTCNNRPARISTASGWPAGASPLMLNLPEGPQLPIPVPDSSWSNSQLQGNTESTNQSQAAAFTATFLSIPHFLKSHSFSCSLVFYYMTRQEHCLLRHPLRPGMLSSPCVPSKLIWVILSKHPPSNTFNLGGESSHPFPLKAFPLSFATLSVDIGKGADMGHEWSQLSHLSPHTRLQWSCPPLGINRSWNLKR